jgi:flavin reductase (DIM6/NTAB) family NADH-FMN oxidoreductase RutF
VHKTIDPAILYFGTPVILISTLNEDGTANLAPMSSGWWLRNLCMLGFDPTSQSPRNLMRTGQCVLNLPSADQVSMVNRLALTTGSDPVPRHKLARGYRHDPGKFETAGLTPVASECVAPPRAGECPVQLEAVLENAWPMAPKGQEGGTAALPLAIQVRIVRVHVEASLIAADGPDRIDPDRWRPLIMSFQQFYGLGARAGESRLASIPEASYRPRAISAGAEIKRVP